MVNKPSTVGISLQDRYNRDVELTIRGLNKRLTTLEKEWRAFYDIEWPEYKEEIQEILDEHAATIASNTSRIAALEAAAIPDPE